MCKDSPLGCCDFDQPVDMLRAGLGGQLLQCTSTAQNNVAFQPSVFDLKMVFGHAFSVEPDNVVVVEQQAIIFVSWLEAKVLSNFLNALLTNYEAKNGPITSPQLPGVVTVPTHPPSLPPK